MELAQREVVSLPNNGDECKLSIRRLPLRVKLVTTPHVADEVYYRRIPPFASGSSPPNSPNFPPSHIHHINVSDSLHSLRLLHARLKVS